MENVYISTSEIEKFLYMNLMKEGYVPSDQEIEDLADMFFDFLIQKGIIADVDVEEE